MKWLHHSKDKREILPPPESRSFYDPIAEDNPEPLRPDGIKVSVRVGENYIKPLFVIVEAYEHKQYGRGKREYLKQFTVAERKTISRWYSRLYDYYLRRGIPVQGVEIKPSTLELLQRAANFFASI